MLQNVNKNVVTDKETVLELKVIVNFILPNIAKILIVKTIVVIKTNKNVPIPESVPEPE